MNNKEKTMPNIENKIKELINSLLIEENNLTLDLHTNLKKDLNLDSISLVGLIMDLNHEFNIEIGSEEIIDENFATIGNIVTFISNKLG